MSQCKAPGPVAYPCADSTENGVSFKCIQCDYETRCCPRHYNQIIANGLHYIRHYRAKPPKNFDECKFYDKMKKGSKGEAWDVCKVTYACANCNSTMDPVGNLPTYHKLDLPKPDNIVEKNPSKQMQKKMKPSQCVHANSLGIKRSDFKSDENRRRREERKRLEEEARVKEVNAMLEKKRHEEKIQAALLEKQDREREEFEKNQVKKQQKKENNSNIYQPTSLRELNVTSEVFDGMPVFDMHKYVPKDAPEDSMYVKGWRRANVVERSLKHTADILHGAKISGIDVSPFYSQEMVCQLQRIIDIIYQQQ